VPEREDAELVSLEDVVLLGDEAVARGRDAYLAGDLAGAEAAFAEALGEDPASAEALHGLARSVIAADAGRAREALERAVALRPGYFEAWRALALVCSAQHDDAAARAAAQRARACAPSEAAAATLALDVG
jgi:tetratricopeptide (TPR) repeat protein